MPMHYFCIGAFSPETDRMLLMNFIGEHLPARGTQVGPVCIVPGGHRQRPLRQMEWPLQTVLSTQNSPGMQKNYYKMFSQQGPVNKGR